MSELKPCPFCGGALSIARAGYEGEAERQYASHCGACGMNGPYAKTKKRALSLSNQGGRVSMEEGDD